MPNISLWPACIPSIHVHTCEYVYNTCKKRNEKTRINPEGLSARWNRSKCVVEGYCLKMSPMVFTVLQWKAHVLPVDQNSLVATALEKLFCGHQATKLRVPVSE